ncbi:MAG: hypothetical protein RLZZ278_1475, partial [Pseudomonadota bacterium]
MQKGALKMVRPLLVGLACWACSAG